MVTSAGSIAYKVKSGDTLWDIAHKYNTTPAKIAQANGINENANLALGKYLRIPSKSSLAKSASVVTAKSSTGGGYAVHTKVQNVYLRKGPGTSHSAITLLSTGATGKLLSINGKWAKIALPDGKCGYVYRKLLTKGAGNASSSSVAKTDVKNTVVAQTYESASERLIQSALDCRGARYRRGGTSRGGFDCSGFTRYIFAKYGVSLPHSSASQSRMGTPVSRGELKSGDLVFFQTYRRGISHVGIYIGNGQFVHAATYGRGVRVDSLNAGYYNSRYRCARRVR